MRGWAILAGIAVLVVILPVIALTGYFGPLAQTIGKVILTIVAILAMAGFGLFGYICIRAQARKWGAGLVVVAILCILLIFWLWTGKFLLVI